MATSPLITSDLAVETLDGGALVSSGRFLATAEFTNGDQANSLTAGLSFKESHKVNSFSELKSVQENTGGELPISTQLAFRVWSELSRRLAHQFTNS